MWHVGQEVVCIANANLIMFLLSGGEIPLKNKVYVIQGITPNTECSNANKVAFSFAEFGPLNHYCECGFRPVLNNDISELRELLNDLPQKADDEPAEIVKIKETEDA